MAIDYKSPRPNRPVVHNPIIIDTPLPQGMEVPKEIQPGGGNTIRDLLQRLRNGFGQPQQVAPAPQPEPMPEPRSVLKR